MRRICFYLRNERGATAAEFAMIVPAFFLVIFGILHLSLLTYSVQQLNYAAEATARCMVVARNSGISTSTCYDYTTTTGTTTATGYFKTVYHGATATPTLSTLDETQTCTAASSYQVVATVNYVISAGFYSKTVPLTARACFPHT